MIDLKSLSFASPSRIMANWSPVMPQLLKRILFTIFGSKNWQALARPLQWPSDSE